MRDTCVSLTENTTLSLFASKSWLFQPRADWTSPLLTEPRPLLSTATLASPWRLLGAAGHGWESSPVARPWFSWREEAPGASK